MVSISVRVYGLLINEQRQVLVSDEYIRGSYYTKFPGGGLEVGEGTRDCLKREFIEEMGLQVEVLDHLYTTDFYQPSAFNSAHQILAIYYTVRALEPIKVQMKEKVFDFDPQQLEAYHKTGETESFRWVNWENFSEDSVTLPIDKLVSKLIKKIK